MCVVCEFSSFQLSRLQALFSFCLSASQVMLVGDSGVGKTCLLVRFKDGAFLAGSFISTVGIDFRVNRHSLLMLRVVITTVNGVLNWARESLECELAILLTEHLRETR